MHTVSALLRYSVTNTNFNMTAECSTLNTKPVYTDISYLLLWILLTQIVTQTPYYIRNIDMQYLHTVVFAPLGLHM